MTWFVPSPILVQPSSLTFRRRSQRIVSTCFLCSSALKKVPQKLTQFALMMSHHCLFDKLIWLFYEMWFGIWFSGFGKNAKTCWDGPDKMPTKKLGRTKCQPQKKVRTKCQPLVDIMSGWHFVRLAFCPTTQWSGGRLFGALAVFFLRKTAVTRKRKVKNR